MVLPQPSLEVLADVSSNPGRHGGVMHVLETCIVTWLKQIKVCMYVRILFMCIRTYIGRQLLISSL